MAEHESGPTGVVASRFVWGILGIATITILLVAVTSSFRERPLLGDQASHILQSISLSDWPPNLSYDERDIAEWRDLGWAPGPDGLFFRRTDSGIAAAKPYGYSLAAAPAVAVFGVDDGMAVTNVVLFVSIGAMLARLLRRRVRGYVVPLVVGAFLLTSALPLYLFIIQPELFLAALVALFAMLLAEAVHRDQPWMLVAAMVPAALLVAERAPMLALVAPLAVWACWRAPDARHRLALVLVGGLSLVLFVVPYLRYSDGESLTAYGGDRYYLQSTSRDWPPEPELVVKWDQDRLLSASYIGDQLSPSNWGDTARAAGATVAGRHTGMVVWAPMTLVAFALVATTRPWRRRRDLASWLWAAGLVYVAGHALLLTETYFGGGQTVGNKYLLHASPAIVGALALAPVPARTVRNGALVALVVGIAMVGPHLRHPEEALERTDRTSAAQRLLPYEDFVLDDIYFRPDG